VKISSPSVSKCVAAEFRFSGFSISNLACRLRDLELNSKAIAIPLPSVASSHAQAAEAEVAWMKGDGETELACRIWRHADPHCVIVHLHGIEGHSQWFEPTARVLNEQGITVYALDRRGAGLNLQNRGDLPDLKTFISDVEAVLRKVVLLHPGKPTFLFANCWSAKAAAVLVNKNHRYADGKPPVHLSGLIMTCPAIVTEADFDPLTKLKIAFSTFASETLKRRLWPIPLTTEMLTGNLVYRQYLEQDPLRLKYVSARFFRETFILGLLAQFVARKIELPLLVLQAEKDQIVDINKLSAWFFAVGSRDKQLKLFANATHSLDFDATCFNDYTESIVQWLRARETKPELRDCEHSG
jgi:acylglycerol lipase